MVYCCKISKESDILSRAFSFCTAERQKKAERLKNTDAKALSITAGLLLRYCLLKLDINEEISYSENEKPYLENSGMFFSLSHSGEYAACVVCDKAVGIDIQKIIVIKERTVRRFCTDGELELINRSACYKTAAVSVWALKESYLKASGCSTEEAFSAEFDICGDTVKGPEGYEFELSYEVEGYVLAVCRAIISDNRK